jgi:hypothetical protein
LLVVVLVIVLSVVLYFRSPLASIFLLCTVVPALVISEVKAQRCRRWGTPISTRDRMASIFRSLMWLIPPVIFVYIIGMVVYVFTHLWYGPMSAWTP